MAQQILAVESAHRDRWLEILDRNGVGPPKSLSVVEVPGGLVQVTAGEPPGEIKIAGVPANVLMFNVSPVQSLKQKRDGRSFISHMLSGEMTLMPRGVPSEWSWKSACDRLDVIVASDVFSDGRELDVFDRFLFRDSEMEALCRHLHRQINLMDRADRLYIESLVIQLAGVLLGRHSTGSGAAMTLPRGGLARPQTKRVLEYVESNLSRELTLRELAGIAGLSTYHFSRMFKQAIGIAPHQYVLERRVERAKGMLRATRQTLVDISFSTGFCGQSHFTGAFRRLTGLTPMEFRRCSRV